MWGIAIHVTVAGLISTLSLGLAVAAFMRGGRNYLEDQRDRLLTQITELTVDAWERESERVSLLHLHARCCERAQAACRDIQSATEVWRKTLRAQIGKLQERFASIARAHGFGLRAFLLAHRVELFQYTPLSLRKCRTSRSTSVRVLSACELPGFRGLPWGDRGRREMEGVALGFKVAFEFRRRFKLEAARRNLIMTEGS